MGYKIWFKYKILRHHYLLVLFVVLTAIALFAYFYRQASDWQILVTVIGGAISLIYIIEKQHLEEAQLFKALFKEFNERYDELNDRLNDIVLAGSSDISTEDKKLLFDYFNLCGEEYLYYSLGYIYPEAWESWYNGMSEYCRCKVIRDLWEGELNAQSYYGFKLPASQSRDA